MVADPQRVEAEPLGEPGALDEQVLVGLARRSGARAGRSGSSSVVLLRAIERHAVSGGSRVAPGGPSRAGRRPARPRRRPRRGRCVVSIGAADGPARRTASSRSCSGRCSSRISRLAVEVDDREVGVGADLDAGPCASRPKTRAGAVATSSDDALEADEPASRRVEEQRDVELGRRACRCGPSSRRSSPAPSPRGCAARGRSRRGRSCRRGAPPRAARCSSRAPSTRARTSRAARCSPSRCPGTRAHGLSSAGDVAGRAALAARSCSTTPRVCVCSRWSGVPVARWSRSRTRDGDVPDDAVVRRVRPRVRPEVALAARPELLLDVVHQRLVVGVDHQRQPGRSPTASKMLAGARRGRGRRCPGMCG